MAARQTPPGARPSRTVRRLPAKVQVGRRDGWSYTTESGLQACFSEGPGDGALARSGDAYAAPVRFSILCEQQLPRPWDTGAEHRLLHESLAQAELADRLGYHGVWAPEHHFLEEQSHSSAPGVFLAACAARTKDIRLGLGVLPLPPAYAHPARVAETAATLDLVSDGRVELGTGETSSGAELPGFGVERAPKAEQWGEASEGGARVVVEEPFAGVDGRYVSMPPRTVIPKPLQKP